MKDFSFQLKRVLSVIDAAHKILLVTHQKPDGDALGSVTAMLAYLEKRGKSPVAFCLHAPQDTFHYLPHVHKITTDTNIFTYGHDLIVVLDSSDLIYAGIEEIVNSLASSLPPIMNIDHHASNEEFGDYHLIDPVAPSTTAILYRLFSHEHKHLIDNHIATCLLTGLLTDTSHFSNPATNEVALEVGADLLKHGARFRQITEATWQSREVSTLQLWGKALTRLQYHPEYRLAVSVLTREDFDETTTEKDTTEGIANFLANLKEADVILLLREQDDGVIRGSLRTVRDDIDVSRLARTFGGGGHLKAAGFGVNGRLMETDEGWRIISD